MSPWRGPSSSIVPAEEPPPRAGADGASDGRPGVWFALRLAIVAACAGARAGDDGVAGGRGWRRGAGEDVSLGLEGAGRDGGAPLMFLPERSTCPALLATPAAFAAASTGMATSGAATFTAPMTAVVAADVAADVADVVPAPVSAPLPVTTVRAELVERGLNHSTPGMGRASEPLSESWSPDAASRRALRRALTPRATERAVSSRTAPVPACQALLIWRPMVPALST